ncbi:DEKNAAC101791 [Brettanomyces naardenensis]|uniref:DEKNAAC101791 n=1 Tax=Brettanomyces naardenensis TaxID=13370 RepID=A0A448YJ64_BRENA|nr:DEKNAAC101791 [Brettanomyces naardenensis]
MEQMGIKPNVMTYNLLGKNYVARTDVVVERLTVWESLLKHMHEQGIKPDLISWYLTLSLLPSDLEHKRVFKLAMIKKGLNKVSKFHDIELTDMLNNDTLIDKMLEYYRSLPRKELDVNCMNTMIYKYLSMNRFADGWMFMTMKNSIRPRNSTLTILLKDCKIRGKLELMIRIINTMRTRYKLINYNSNRMVLDYLLKMPDDGLPEWYPVLVKYMLRYDLSYGIDRYRRLDVMVKRLQFKLDKNFAGHERHGNGILLSTIPLNQVTRFETKFFNNMEKMVVLENESLAKIERDFLLIDEDDEIGTDERLETTDRESITEEVVSNDQWIRNVILKSYYDLMRECLE